MNIINSDFGLLLKNYHIGPVLRGYIEADLALSDFEAHAKEVAAKALTTNNLNGENWLTGICVGYALECVALVTKEDGREGPLPSLMPQVRSPKMRHVQRLMIKAIFEHIPRGEDPSTLKATSTNRTLIKRIFYTYIRLQEQVTGVSLKDFVGGHDCTLLPMEEQLHALRGSKGHHIMIVAEEGQALPAWHAIYINTTFGIIGDVAYGLLWRIQKSYLPYFGEILAHFCKTYYGEHRAVTLAVCYTPPSGSQEPLWAQRFWQRAATTYMVGRKLGAKAAIGYVKSLHRKAAAAAAPAKKRPSSAPLIAKTFPLSLEFLGEQLVLGPFDPTPQELATILSNLCFISVHWDTPEEAQRTFKLVSAISVYTVGTPELIACILRVCLNRASNYAMSGREYPEHIIHDFIPKILEWRRRLPTPLQFRLESILRNVEPCREQINLIDYLVREGADINDKGYNGRTILQKAKDNNESEGVIILLEAMGAKATRS